MIGALGLGDKEHVAVVGAGGKTSLLFALAGELLRKGKRVVTATTTKVWVEEARRAPALVLTRSDPAPLQKVAHGLQEHGHLFVGHERLASGKVAGIRPKDCDLLYRHRDIDTLLVEADGAAGRPVKVPAGNEPVIPETTTVVVAVLGLDALGETVRPEIVFRMERFQEVVGIKEGDTLSAEALARVFGATEGLFRHSPAGARRIAFLNKLDLLPSPEEGLVLAQEILNRFPGVVERAVLGSVQQNTYFIVMNKAASSRGHG